MKGTFHNTIHEQGELLLASREKADNQEAELLEIFQGAPGPLTPFEALEIYRTRTGDDKVPITSIRRAITNLTRSGYLAKLRGLVPGPLGKKNHLWTTATEAQA